MLVIMLTKQEHQGMAGGRENKYKTWKAMLELPSKVDNAYSP